MSSDAHFPQVDMNIYGLSEKSLILKFLNGTLSEIKVQKLLLGGGGIFSNGTFVPKGSILVPV